MGVVRTNPIEKSFAELFQKRPPAPAGAPRFFFLVLFLLTLLSQKEKGRETVSNYYTTHKNLAMQNSVNYVE